MTKELKTKKTRVTVNSFLAGLKNAKRVRDAKTLVKIYRSCTRKPAKMWGPSIIGFGDLTYKRADGSEHSFLATGFSPRSTGLVLYFYAGFAKVAPLLRQLGPHKKSKGCLCLKDLEAIDAGVLKKLITANSKALKNKL